MVISDSLKQAPAVVAGELIDAFDTIKAYRDVIPANYFNPINDAIGGWTYELEQEGRLPSPDRAERHEEVRAKQITPEVEADVTQNALSDQTVRDLVARILPRDDDEAAKALITLIHALAYNDDCFRCGSIAMWACDAAYQKTLTYSGVAGKFFDEATAEFSLRAA
jgi:hypothetical protein